MALLADVLDPAELATAVENGHVRHQADRIWHAAHMSTGLVS